MLRISLALLTGAVLVLLALLWRERQRVELLQSQLRATAAHPRDTSAKIREPAVQLPPPAARETLPTPETKKDAPTPTRNFTETERNFRKQMTEYHRWTALAKKADLLSALHLPPEKLAALKDLLAERDYVERDAREAARAAGIDRDEAAAAEVAKVDERIRGVLGEADYASYLEQISLSAFRQQLEGTPIPGSMVDAGAPLTPEQKTWIAGMFYRSFNAHYTTDQSTQSYDPDAARRAFAAALLSEAPSHLTPTQVDALREYFRKDDELAGHMKALIREQSPKK